jgi:hypothetical protein
VSAIDGMCHMAHTCAMPKQRFPVMLEPEQLKKLRAIQDKTGARVGEQIRRAVAKWIAEQDGGGRSVKKTRRA